MFSDKYGLTEAVLSGRKTQTRRIIKINAYYLAKFREEYYNASFDLLDGKNLIESYLNNNPKEIPYKKGEIVAVAQSYENAGYKCYYYRDTDEFMFFMKDGKDIPISPISSKNKMFVKPEYMPHQMRITNIRIERLQDISDDDCLAEGILKEKTAYGEDSYNIKIKDKAWYYGFDTPREAYAALIDKVGNKGDWERNPYVFVYDFELIK